MPLKNEFCFYLFLFSRLFSGFFFLSSPSPFPTFVHVCVNKYIYKYVIPLIITIIIIIIFSHNFQFTHFARLQQFKINLADVSIPEFIYFNLFVKYCVFMLKFAIYALIYVLIYQTHFSPLMLLILQCIILFYRFHCKCFRLDFRVVWF